MDACCHCHRGIVKCLDKIVAATGFPRDWLVWGGALTPAEDEPRVNAGKARRWGRPGGVRRMLVAVAEFALDGWKKD